MDCSEGGGDSERCVLGWNGRGEWRESVGFWRGKDGAGFLFQRLDGFAVGGVDIRQLFGVFEWEIAAGVLSVVM